MIEIKCPICDANANLVLIDAGARVHAKCEQHGTVGIYDVPKEARLASIKDSRSWFQRIDDYAMGRV